MRQGLLRHIGLAKPYRFERTLIVLAAAALLLFIAVIAVLLDVRGDLTAGTPRSWYFVYLVVLIALACLLTPRPVIAAALLSLAAIETGLGAGSIVLYKYRLIPSPGLVPLDLAIRRGDWHPLLQVVPVPTTKAEAAEGVPAVNSDGIRGQEITEGDLRGKIVVALFGGSTTFDGQPDGLSWPERLQDILGNRYAVINRGVGGYSTAEHVIQTAFYERTKGVPPRCAVYYVGWNDLRSAHVPNLDPGYATFHLPWQTDHQRIRRSDTPRAISPLVIFAGRLAGLAFDTIRADYPEGTPSRDPDPALERIFARNVATISAINRQRGIRTIWVGQLMNRAELRQDRPSPWVPFVYPDATYGLIERLNGILKTDADSLGDVYVGLPVEPLEKDGFADEGHFTEEGSLQFATLLAPAIARHCR